ncbi:MAG TPA: DNA polymerase III subunit gamma/tau [Planctomycetaceae bacterium]|nr:hypothetical protein [Blastopirellula sp.]HAY82402.1 DNA polymerase III subunit gamma/tau [Planctomycetaceae bacterium]
MVDPEQATSDSAASSGEYVVVARRYRPGTFADLVGQNQVSQALCNAIATNRVGHAYLFTGARGVGKTSTARILAKALNCSTGPSPTPCDQCDICDAIAGGEDVDVIEIDGASNRGIDEIRQLRSNVSIRPSRSRFKIYIIDEVHMLTSPAFNALLKTLEEPPEHVKFIFCTTDPEKIPITVLSRCQRFDFPPVEMDSIIDRLRYIVGEEGVTAEEEALRLLARRAAGSMRDSQSLLEQLLSFCTEAVTVEDVHVMLGTARSHRLAEMVGCLLEHDAAGALAKLDLSVQEGVDVGQLAEQLLGYFRDMMTAVAGCDPELMRHCSPADHAQLVEGGKALGLETILAIAQILDQTLVRLRQSVHARTLVEVALVRICSLENLDDLTAVIQAVQQGQATAPAPRGPAAAPAPSRPSSPQPRAAQKKTELVPQAAAEEPAPVAAAAPPDRPQGTQSASELWKQTLASLEDMTADHARKASGVAISAPNRLVVTFGARYSFSKDSCERPQQRARIEAALSRVAGRTMRLDFEIAGGGAVERPQRKPVKTRVQRIREAESHPLVEKAIELFDCEVANVTEPKRTNQEG